MGTSTAPKAAPSPQEPPAPPDCASCTHGNFAASSALGSSEALERLQADPIPSLIVFQLRSTALGWEGAAMASRYLRASPTLGTAAPAAPAAKPQLHRAMWDIHLSTAQDSASPVPPCTPFLPSNITLGIRPVWHCSSPHFKGDTTTLSLKRSRTKVRL